MIRSRLTRAIAIAFLAMAGSASGSNESGSSSQSGNSSWFEAGQEAVARARRNEASRNPDARARNVILFLGDGMGITTVTAARILEGQLRGETGEENWLSFERLSHTALIKTYNTNQQTPDSAGTMTAIVTGVKTRAGHLSVGESVGRGDHAAARGKFLSTIVEQAEQRGLSTGVVTTAPVTHATPGACYAHSPERSWQNDALLSPEARSADFPDIARQLIEFPHGDGLEVALGGGRMHFLPITAPDPEHPGRTGSRLDGRDLTAEWVARRARATYVWNRAQLDGIGQTEHLLGLFEPADMRFEIERAGDAAGEPSLTEMALKALEIVSRNPKGYFLMVEGGRIDHGHHLGNAHRALHETVEFSRTIRAVLERIDLRETLVVVTADHGHVFTIAGSPTRGNDILGYVVSNDLRGEPETEPTRDTRGTPYTTLGYQNGPGRVTRTFVWPYDLSGPERFWLGARARFNWLQRAPDGIDVDPTARDYLQHAAVPLYGETHGGQDVAAYAGGPGAWLFDGVHEQNYLYHAMAEALGWSTTPR